MKKCKRLEEANLILNIQASSRLFKRVCDSSAKRATTGLIGGSSPAALLDLKEVLWRGPASGLTGLNKLTWSQSW